MEHNKLYTPTKNQRIVLGFWNSPKEVARLAVPAEYASAASFRGSLAAAVKRLGLPVIIRSIKGSIYLIKEQLV